MEDKSRRHWSSGVFIVDLGGIRRNIQYKNRLFLFDFELVSCYWEKNLLSLINMKTRTFLNNVILADLLSSLKKKFPTNIYLFKVSNRNTEKGIKYFFNKNQ